MSDILDVLKTSAEDPMWADHCEMTKRSVRKAAYEIERLRAEVELLEDGIARRDMRQQTNRAVLVGLSIEQIDQMLDNYESEGQRLADQVSELRAEVERLKAAAVPEGWKLVPVKATDEMMVAGRDDALDQQCFEGFARLDAEGVYDAMLAAAPQPPKP